MNNSINDSVVEENFTQDINNTKTNKVNFSIILLTILLIVQMTVPIVAIIVIVINHSSDIPRCSAAYNCTKCADGKRTCYYYEEDDDGSLIESTDTIVCDCAEE